MRWFGLLFLLALALPAPAKAVCPLCTVAIAGGLGVSRWLGIDDLITALWLGGVLLSSGFWLGSWLHTRWPVVPWPNALGSLLMILFTLPPLWWTHSIGLPGNTWGGYDKVIVGMVLGGGAFLAGFALDKLLRYLNNGQIIMYFQKVIVPVTMLTIMSLVLFFLKQ